jgi:glycerol kinase
LAVGVWDDYRRLVQGRAIDRVFEPGADAASVQREFLQWQKALERAKNWEDE